VITILQTTVATVPAALVKLNVTLNVPAAVGGPETTPEELRVNPAGSPDRVKVPVPLNERVVLVYTTVCSPVGNPVPGQAI